MVRPRPHRKIVEEGTYLLKIQSDNGFDHQGMIRRKKCQLSPRPSLSHSQWKHPVPVEAQVNQRPSVRLPCPSAINHHGIMRRRMVPQYAREHLLVLSDRGRPARVESFLVRHLSPPTTLISAAGGQFAFISRAQLSPPSARSRLPCPVRTQPSSSNSPSRRGADSERESGMAGGGGGMVFEPHAGAVAGGDVVFCAAIVCLSLLSMVIFAAAGSSSSSGAAGDEGMKPRRRGRRANGPVFVGGWGCACGGCSAGAGVCGTYLS